MKILHIAIKLLCLLCCFAPPVIADTNKKTVAACTEIGCINGITVLIDPNYRWQKGSYAFEIQSDQYKIKCLGNLPLMPCGSESISCDVKGVMIAESGCALSSDTHGFGDIMVNSSPEHLSIIVNHNGKVLANQSFVPKYIISRPNGSRCEPACRNATVVLSLKNDQ